jgi:hypothetical protein
MVGDFNRIVFQNILKGDFPGALNAVGDALNPFSDSLELRYDGPAVGLLRWSSFGGLKGRRAGNKFSQVREAGKRPERGCTRALMHANVGIKFPISACETFYLRRG